MKILMTAFVFLSITFAVSAQNYYVRQGATGTGDGSDWTNAFTDLPTSLVRGATYYIAGGSYAGYTFDDAESGTSVITIQKATASDHGTDTGWDSTYANGVAQFGNSSFIQGYYTVNGVTGGGPGSWDSGFGIAFGGSNGYIITIRSVNWWTAPMPTHLTFEHVDFQGNSGPGGTYDGIYSNVSSGSAPGAGPSNLTVRYSYIHDLAVGQNPFYLVDVNNAVIEYNLIARVPSDSSHHAQGIVAQGCNNLVVRYNKWEDIAGTAIVSVFPGDGTTDMNNGIYFYGNIVYCTPSYASGLGKGIVGTLSQATSATNIKVYNNTVVNCQTNYNWGVELLIGTGHAVYNNLWVNSTANIMLASGGGNVEDYNTEINVVDTNSSLTGPHDKVLASGDPFTNETLDDFSLTGPTAAGLGLAAPYNMDMLGNTVDASGQWDRGALQYTGTSAATPPPSLPAPTGLHAIGQ